MTEDGSQPVLFLHINTGGVDIDVLLYVNSQVPRSCKPLGTHHAQIRSVSRVSTSLSSLLQT